MFVNALSQQTRSVLSYLLWVPFLALYTFLLFFYFFALTPSFSFLDSLGYIGHSLGTDQMFVLQSLMPEVGQIIRPYIALAPIAYLGNIWSVVRPFVPIGTGVLRFAHMLHHYQHC